MSLQEFLNQNAIDNLTAEVPISKRFKDKAGNIMKFTIKAMTDAEFEDYRKQSMSLKKGGKFEMNLRTFNTKIVIGNTINPNFKDAASIKALGCITSEQYLSKVLLSGEIAELSKQIQALSGFDTDIEDLKEEVKN